MTVFSKVKKYLRTFQIGDVITRKSLMNQRFSNRGAYTIDSYRLWFTNAGYLNHIGRGKYEYIKLIPEDISSRTLRKEAYPHYKTWNEYKHLD